MLILPKGYGEFEDRLRQFDPKSGSDSTAHEKTPVMARDGFKVGDTDVDTREAQALTPLQWKLPLHFCPDCGRRDLAPTKAGGQIGGFMFDEPRPEINMRPNEALIYFICLDCHREQRNQGDTPALVYPDGGAAWERQTLTRQARIQKNIIEYIKMMRNRGEEPLARCES